MPYTVDFVNVSATGLEPWPVVDALAGLGASEVCPLPQRRRELRV